MMRYARNLHKETAAGKVRSENERFAKVFAFIIVISVAFVGGFVMRGNNAILEMLGMAPDISNSKTASGDVVMRNTYHSLGARVGEVEDILAEDSLDSYNLDTATKNVFDAFAEATKDSYLCYYDVNRYAALVHDNSNSYSGVGVLFSEYNGHAYAVDVFENSPAQIANVQPGDFVVAIDGDRGHDWSIAEVLSALRRNEGTDVVITWRHPETLDDEGGKEFTTTLICAASTVENVTTDLSETVGYIRLKQITQNAAGLVKDAVSDLESRGATSFVLDIRDNPGGFLTQAVDIASLFVKSGPIVKVQTKKVDENVKNATGATITDKPLVVLVNENTAASAEVIAAALQDNKRATLVGKTTLGKGSVQVVRDLSFGGALCYTAAYYKSPLGRDIDGVGIVPDITVSLSDESDNQKALAFETAQSLVKK